MPNSLYVVRYRPFKRSRRSSKAFIISAPDLDEALRLARNALTYQAPLGSLIAVLEVR